MEILSKRKHLGILLVRLYSIKLTIIRKIIIKLAYRIDGGELYSGTLRKIFHEYYNVKVGLYSFGACFIPGKFDKFTTVGRYCSFARSARVMNRNHPVEFKSTHPFFFNPALKYCKKEIIDYISLEIGNDVWIGHNAIILPKVRVIENGAIIAAGSVVTRNVPSYSIVAGNPAMIIKYRFDKDKIRDLNESKWWEKEISEVVKEYKIYTKPF
jgi:virginiamycin A acetyltransferase